MLTIDFDRFPVGPGNTVLDLGCGGGRHAYEAYRRGADVVAVDMAHDELLSVQAMLDAMAAEGQAPAGASAIAVHGDALSIPFPADSFDRVIAAEILEHIPSDAAVIDEIARVVRPGGLVGVTVPRWLPERICWALSEAYHEVEGGHVRIYRYRELEQKLRRAGLQPTGYHFAHALHSPFWWLKCAVGGETDDHALTKAYHRMLVWDLTKRPLLTQVTERALNPLIGKSLVLYARKPELVRAAA